MPLTKNTPYPSDEIAALKGFDGTESKHVISWCRKFCAEFSTRVVLALNQHYPELKSGYYLNKYLIALIQEAIGSLGVSIVIEDNYRREGIVPVEPPASLGIADDYILVNDALEIRGRLRVWESLGGKAEFYHDKFLFEIVTDSELAGELLRTLREVCRSRKIEFVEKEGETNPRDYFF